MKKKIVKRVAKKPESLVTLKRRIKILTKENAKLQKILLWQANKIYESEPTVRNQKAKNSKIEGEIQPDSNIGVMAKVVQSVRHDEPPKK